MLILIVSAILLTIFNLVLCLNLCGDWIQYKDLKCFKVLEKKGSEEEDLGNCTQFEQSSTLITIHSKEEQEFLNNILSKYNNISTFSWIAIKYLDKTYKWLDRSLNNYTNWSEDAVKDGIEQCAQMFISGNNLGKWTDVSCKKAALIVCQKSQEISFNLLGNIIDKQQIQFENMMNVIEKQENKIKEIENQLKTNLIPIGFLYTQLPNTSTPQQLWPQFKWIEVTKEYSGLFFRAEGDGSLPFGEIQTQNQSWISNVYFDGALHDALIKNYYDSSATLSQTKWIQVNPPEISIAVGILKFYTTGGEVCPKNTAIKIFKRIE